MAILLLSMRYYQGQGKATNEDESNAWTTSQEQHTTPKIVLFIFQTFGHFLGLFVTESALIAGSNYSAFGFMTSVANNKTSSSIYNYPELCARALCSSVN
ncbi:hypothetical protein OS493_027419 [Desmophyllum pertusum]|uniref:Uncharacterized protein n=1 Tax=Desmophyllum pertusum TaxID=174260 RepID=A0A9W9YM34_9CNID|nr:hypothetical protein OS493_027419 [Desmophyllum pertusum]